MSFSTKYNCLISYFRAPVNNDKGFRLTNLYFDLRYKVIFEAGDIYLVF